VDVLALAIALDATLVTDDYRLTEYHASASTTNKIRWYNWGKAGVALGVTMHRLQGNKSSACKCGPF